MELGISTASFYTKLATEDTFSQIASIGANVCEVFLSSFSEYNGAILDEIFLQRESDWVLSFIPFMAQQY